MRDKQHRKAKPVLQIEQKIDDLRLYRNIKRRYRFISHNQTRIERKGARDANALALPARKSMREAGSCDGRHLYEFEQFKHARLTFRSGYAVHFQRFGDNVAHHHARIER